MPLFVAPQPVAPIPSPNPPPRSRPPPRTIGRLMTGNLTTNRRRPNPPIPKPERRRPRATRAPTGRRTAVAAAAVVAVAVVAVSRARTTRPRRLPGQRRREQRAGESPKLPPVTTTPGAGKTSDSDDTDDTDDAETTETTARGQPPPPSSPSAQERIRRAGGVTPTAQPPTIRPTPSSTSVPRERKPPGPTRSRASAGSTRLEAKRQRRRDGRDAGRRRPPILSEAEFLARREAVDRVMVVRDKVRSDPPHQGARYTQIAVLEDGVVVEHFVTSRRFGVAGRQHLSRHRAERAARRWRRPSSTSAAAATACSTPARSTGRPPGSAGAQQDRAGAQTGRLRRRPGQQGPRRAQGRAADHARCRWPGATWCTCRARPPPASAASCPTPNASGSRRSSRGGASRRRGDHPDRLRRGQSDENPPRREPAAGALERTSPRRPRRSRPRKPRAAVALYEEPDVLVKVIRDLFNEDFSGLDRLRLRCLGDHH